MIWNGPSFQSLYFDRMLHNLLHHDKTWLGDLTRKAYGWHRSANPRTHVRATKRYADGRQKGRK